LQSYKIHESKVTKASRS